MSIDSNTFINNNLDNLVKIYIQERQAIKNELGVLYLGTQSNLMRCSFISRYLKALSYNVASPMTSNYTFLPFYNEFGFLLKGSYCNNQSILHTCWSVLVFMLFDSIVSPLVGSLTFP